MRITPPFGFDRVGIFRNRGAVLFEVVVALLLFVGAASIITGALNASLNSVERLRLNTHATSLAVSVMSELQMGTKTLASGGPQVFSPPLDGWTWEAVASPVENSLSLTNEAAPFKRVEIIVRHNEPPLVYRLCEVIRIQAPTTDSLSAF